MHLAQSRRSFIKTGLTISCLATLAPLGSFAAGNKSVRLGGPAFFDESDPEKLARRHRELGYRAAYCPNVDVKDSEKIRAFRKAFAEQDVVIAEVGRWVNLMDADAAKRKENLQKVTDGLALAEAMGARCCVDIAGSFNKEDWAGPEPRNFTMEHFDLAVENARKIIDAVKPRHAKFCYEMMGWAYPHDVQSTLKLLKAVDREGFAVHVDPCNMINSADKFYNNTALLNECFDKLGKWITSCHAKDLKWIRGGNLHFVEVAPGQGALDYKTYLKRVAQLPQNPPLMLEHLSTAEEYAAAKAYVFKVGEATGHSF